MPREEALTGYDWQPDFASSTALPCKVLRTRRASGHNSKDLSCNQDDLDCISFQYISPWALCTVHRETKQIRDLSRQPRMHFSCWGFMYCTHRKQFSRKLAELATTSTYLDDVTSCYFVQEILCAAYMTGKCAKNNPDANSISIMHAYFNAF